jgi:hypothetical protein
MPLLIIPGMKKRARLQAVGGRPEKEVLEAFGRALDMLETGLQGGPFLYGRDEPGRGDVAAGVQLLAVGYAGGIDEAMSAVRAHPGVLALPRRVFRACSSELPAWWP